MTDIVDERLAGKITGIMYLVNQRNLGTIKIVLDGINAKCQFNHYQATIPFSVFDNLEPVEILELIQKQSKGQLYGTERT